MTKSPRHRRRRAMSARSRRGVPRRGPRRRRPRRPHDRASRRPCRTGRGCIVGSYGDGATVDAPARRPRASRRSSTARRARWSASRSRTRPATSATTSPAASRCSRRPARSGSIACVFSSTAAVYGVPDATPDPRGRAAPTDQPVRRDEARVRRRARSGTRRAYGTAQRHAPLLQRRRRDRGARRGPRPRDAPDPGRSSRAVEAGRPVTLFGDDYPTPDGTCIRDYIHVADLADAHLRAIEATARRRRAHRRGAVVCNLGNGGGFSNLEVLAAAERVVGRADPARGRAAADGRPAGARRLGGAGRRRCSAGGRARPALDEMVGSAWAWRQAPPGRLRGLSRRGGSAPPRGASRCRRARAGGAAGAVGIRVAAGPVVAHRPDEPQPDQHRHKQAQDGDLVRADPERVDQAGRRWPVEQRADDLRCPCRRARTGRRTRRAGPAATAGA